MLRALIPALFCISWASLKAAALGAGEAAGEGPKPPQPAAPQRRYAPKRTTEIEGAMEQHSLGLHFADEKAWIALVRRRSHAARAELLGWRVMPQAEWKEEGIRIIRELVGARICSAARAVPLASVFSRKAPESECGAALSREGLVDLSCRELGCAERLIGDAACGSHGAAAFVALVKESSAAALKSECGAASDLVVFLALELPALYALLALLDPGAAAARVSLIHLSSTRCLAGVFVRGAPRYLAEWDGETPAASLARAQEWLKARDEEDGDESSPVFLSGGAAAENGPSSLKSLAAGHLAWSPAQAIARASGALPTDEAALATAIALAVCALGPEASGSVNFLRSEARAAAKEVRHLERLMWSARAVLWAALVGSCCLLWDASHRHAAGVALAEEEARLTQTERDEQLAGAQRKADELAAQELRSPTFAPLAVGETLRTLLAMMPPAARVDTMRLDPLSTEVQGGASQELGSVDVAQAVSQAFPGAQVQAEEGGDFVVRLVRKGAEEGHE